MCAIDDGDRYILYDRKRRRSAKLRQCDECGRDIPIGEIYSAATGLYDGRWDTHQTCGHCAVGQDWLIENCGGFLHGGLVEELDEHAEEYRKLRFGLLRLRAGMRRKWRARHSAALLPLPKMPRPIADVLAA